MCETLKHSQAGVDGPLQLQGTHCTGDGVGVPQGRARWGCDGQPRDGAAGQDQPWGVRAAMHHGAPSHSMEPRCQLCSPPLWLWRRAALTRLTRLFCSLLSALWVFLSQYSGSTAPGAFIHSVQGTYLRPELL